MASFQGSTHSDKAKSHVHVAEKKHSSFAYASELKAGDWVRCSGGA